MKKIIVSLVLVIMLFALCSCEMYNQAERVSYNVSKEADAFNVLRRISVINMRTDKPIFEMVGQFSVQNSINHELEVIVQTGPNEYKKHLIYLNEWTMYVVEDVGGADVSPFKYEINFLPEMILPYEIKPSY